MTRHDNTSCQLAVSTIKDVWTRYDKERERESSLSYRRTRCATGVALNTVSEGLTPSRSVSFSSMFAYFNNVVLPSFLLILSLFPLILPFFSRFAFLCRHLSRLGPLASAGCGRFLGPGEGDLKIVAEKLLGRWI